MLRSLVGSEMCIRDRFNFFIQRRWQEGRGERGVQVRAFDGGQPQVGEGLRQADQEARQGAGGAEEEAPEGAKRRSKDPMHRHREACQIQGKVSLKKEL